MLIDPEGYRNMKKDKSLAELVDLRDRIIKRIMEYEKDRKRGPVLGFDSPDPFSIYIYNHLYLAEVCKLIREKIDEDSFEHEILKHQ